MLTIGIFERDTAKLIHDQSGLVLSIIQLLIGPTLPNSSSFVRYAIKPEFQLKLSISSSFFVVAVRKKI